MGKKKTTQMTEKEAETKVQEDLEALRNNDEDTTMLGHDLIRMAVQQRESEIEAYEEGVANGDIDPDEVDAPEPIDMDRQEKARENPDLRPKRLPKHPEKGGVVEIANTDPQMAQLMELVAAQQAQIQTLINGSTAVQPHAAQLQTISQTLAAQQAATTVAKQGNTHKSWVKLLVTEKMKLSMGREIFSLTPGLADWVPAVIGLPVVDAGRAQLTAIEAR